MSWASILKLVLSLASSIAQYMERKQLLDAGEARQIAKNLTAASRKVEAAVKARNNVVHISEAAKHDKNNRNNPD